MALGRDLAMVADTSVPCHVCDTKKQQNDELFIIIQLVSRMNVRHFVHAWELFHPSLPALVLVLILVL